MATLYISPLSNGGTEEGQRVEHQARPIILARGKVRV